MANTKKDPKKSWSSKFTDAIRDLTLGKGKKTTMSTLKENRDKKKKMLDEIDG